MQFHEVIVENGGYDVAAWLDSVRLLHDLTQRSEVVTASNANLEAVVDVAVFDLVWQEEEVLDLLFLWDRQRDGHHRVKRDRNSVAFRAAHS